MLITNMKYRKMRQTLRMRIAKYYRQYGKDFATLITGTERMLVKRYGKNSKIKRWVQRRRLGNEFTKNKSWLIRMRKGA